jgi:hypothetical protein
MSTKLTCDALAIELGQVALERDTYRELCEELVGIIKEHINYVDAAIHCDFKNAIAKAEAILGEKNGTSN